MALKTALRKAYIKFLDRVFDLSPYSTKYGVFYQRLSSVLRLTPPTLYEIPKDQRVLVLAPHPDDDVLGCGGVLSLIESEKVHVAFMTDGRFGDPEKPPHRLAEVRRMEAQKAAVIYGAGQLYFLDYPDGGLRVTEESVKRVLHLLTEIHPNRIFVPFPLESHGDHRTTSFILYEALKAFLPDPECFCYEIWSASYPNIIIDISSAMQRKLEALNCHKSQIERFDLAGKILGLNSFRSMGCPPHIRYAEAFFRCQKREFLRLVEALRPFI